MSQHTGVPRARNYAALDDPENPGWAVSSPEGGRKADPVRTVVNFLPFTVSARIWMGWSFWKDLLYWSQQHYPEILLRMCMVAVGVGNSGGGMCGSHD